MLGDPITRVNASRAGESQLNIDLSGPALAALNAQYHASRRPPHTPHPHAVPATCTSPYGSGSSSGVRTAVPTLTLPHSGQHTSDTPGRTRNSSPHT